MQQVAGVDNQTLMHLVPVLLQIRVHAGKRTFHRKPAALFRQEVVLDGDLADLPAVGLEAADLDLDAAERNRVGRLR